MTPGQAKKAAVELQKFFTEALLNGNYQITKIEEKYVTLSVIGYDFNFLIMKEHENMYNTNVYASFMHIDMDTYGKELYKQFKPIYMNWVKKELIEKKRRELEALESEL